MAFPQTPLPVHVYIAPGADPAGDPAAYSWTEITNDVRVESGITHEGGRSNEGTRVDAGKVTMSINNRGGNYTPRNPVGAWYGLLAKNTPLQLRVDRFTDTFTRTVAAGSLGTSDGGSGYTYSSSASWSVNGSAAVASLATANSVALASLTNGNTINSDITFRTSCSVVTTGGSMYAGMLLRRADSLNYYAALVEFGTGGALKLQLSKTIAGVYTSLSNVSTGLTYTAAAVYRVRIQVDGTYIRMKVWADAGTEPSTWALTVSNNEVNGYLNGLYAWRLNTNTNPGAVAVTFDDLAVQAVLFTGNVVEWPARWDQSGADCWAPITAAGVLRRLQQRATPLRSPLRRQLGRYPGAGYWPLEDGSDATAASSAVSGGLPADVIGVTFAADDSLPGAETALKFNSTSSRISGRVTGDTGIGFSWMMIFRLNATPASNTTLVEWRGSGKVVLWRITATSTGLITQGYDSTDTLVTSGGTTYGGADPTQWFALQLEIEQDGSNTDWALLWHQVGDDTFYAQTGSYAGSTGKATKFVIPGSTQLVDARFAHIYAGPNTLPFVTTSFRRVANGWAGETAAERVTRLCAEEGVRVDIEAGDSTLMGPQRIDTFVNLLRAAEDADLGLLYEQGTGLGFRPSGARYSPTTLYTLDFDAGHIASPPEPTDDDQQVRNDVTASRDGGGSAQVTDASHIALNGRYDDAVTVNVMTDAQLPDHAGWRVHTGTIDELRWPHIALDLARNPSVIPAWMSGGIGTRFGISNPPDQLAGVPIDLLIEGWTQTLTPYGWDVDLNCSPARVWDVLVLDDSADRLDTAGCVVAEAATSSATTLTVVTSEGAIWAPSATYPTDYPLDLMVGGEQVTVSATADGIKDTFTRATGTGWGSSDTGHAWSIVSGSVANTHVNGTRGVFNLAAAGDLVVAELTGITVQPRVVTARLYMPAAVTGVGGAVTLSLRAGTGTTFIGLNVQHNTTGSASTWIQQLVNGVETTYDSAFPALSSTATAAYLLRWEIADTYSRARLWVEGTREPGHWTTQITTTAAPVAGTLQVRATRNASSTNGNPFWYEFDALDMPQTQRLTVTRSVNAVVKAQAAGADVRLWTPSYLAL